MATMTNVIERVERLISSGRVYYGQESDNLRNVLMAESCHWKVTQRVIEPGDFGGYVTKVERAAWGGGPNEDMQSLVESVRELLYGDQKLGWEFIREYPVEFREYAGRILAGGVQVEAASVYRFLDARRFEKREDYATLPDPRDLERAINAWLRWRPEITTVAAERIGRWDVGTFGDIPDDLLPRSDQVRLAGLVSQVTGWMHHARLQSPPHLVLAEWQHLLRCGRDAADQLMLFGLTGSMTVAAELRREMRDNCTDWRTIADAIRNGEPTIAGGVPVHRVGHLIVPRIVACAPEQQSLTEIANEPNAEIRRVRIERFAGADRPAIDGWRRYIVEASPTVLDSRRNDIDVTMEFLLDFGGAERALLCTCKTGRLFVLPVPVEIATCEQAQTAFAADDAGEWWRIGDRPTYRSIGRS